MLYAVHVLRLHVFLSCILKYYQHVHLVGLGRWPHFVFNALLRMTSNMYLVYLSS